MSLFFIILFTAITCILYILHENTVLEFIVVSIALEEYMSSILESDILLIF